MFCFRQTTRFAVQAASKWQTVVFLSSSTRGAGLTNRSNHSLISSQNNTRYLLHCENNTIQQARNKSNAKSTKQVVESKGGASDITVGQKVKQAGKDATYTGVVILGLGITGVMFYAIGRELFSGQSSSGVYGRALKDCKKNDEVSDVLGLPIKGYGEMNRRGRRRHVSHTVFEKDGIPHMRLKFYIEGPHRKGTVHVEVQQNERGKYEYRYLFVELDGYPHRTIVLEDRR